jgi:hypothetical protein
MNMAMHVLLQPVLREAQPWPVFCADDLPETQPPLSAVTTVLKVEYHKLKGGTFLGMDRYSARFIVAIPIHNHVSYGGMFNRETNSIRMRNRHTNVAKTFNFMAWQKNTLHIIAACAQHCYGLPSNQLHGPISVHSSHGGLHLLSLSISCIYIQPGRHTFSV